jgi:hypothetical protein
MVFGIREKTLEMEGKYVSLHISSSEPAQIDMYFVSCLNPDTTVSAIDLFILAFPYFF